MIGLAVFALRLAVPPRLCELCILSGRLCELGTLNEFPQVRLLPLFQ